MSILIRLPNWLGDVAMALPVIRAMTKKTPELTLTGLPMYQSLLPALGCFYDFMPLPKKGMKYYPSFLLRKPHFQQTVLFANSQRADIEAFLARIPHRYGISWPARKRKLLNHRYEIAGTEIDGHRHQTMLWRDFTLKFGFHEGISLAPLIQKTNSASHIVLICGSENAPKKRWAIDNWRKLIQSLSVQSALPILLTGTAKDWSLTQEIQKGFGKRVSNMAGKTDMVGFLETLQQAALVIGNDTGGLHLANASGIPVVGLYGPTNPERTRPIYEGIVEVIQPEGCLTSDSGEMRDISPESVAEITMRYLKD